MAASLPNSTAKKTPYDNMNAVFSTRNVQDHAGHLIPFLKPHSNILDIGCGPGSITIDFARRCPKGQVIGLDLNKESLAVGQEAAVQLGLANVSFQHEDASESSFLDNFGTDSFDIVHAHQVMLHLSDPVKALKAMRRVVKPGGVVGIRDKTIWMWEPMTEAMQQQKDDFETLVPHPEGGCFNHIWTHEAGFPWDNIKSGSAGWEYSGREMRELVAPGLQQMTKEATLRKGVRDEAFFDQLAGDWDAWIQNPAGRVIALDGWVVAEK